MLLLSRPHARAAEYSPRGSKVRSQARRSGRSGGVHAVAAAHRPGARSLRNGAWRLVMRFPSASWLAAAILAAAGFVTGAAAQEPAPPIVRETVARVVTDPTTYVLPLTV